ncbi:hypothetical protein [Streptomyces sp. NRRL S-146]|uniref:hypothetical protein n=1 Tax=Streptomyces sp. NRRL S-146 TaxID=1463884 RepID=UPI0004CAFD67|nr:hypothetical protein [Streptomyces sp. NRRL S-146]
MPAARHHNLTVPDHKTLRADAERQVKDELGQIPRPDDRFKRACEIVQQADLEIAAHAEERNEAAMSLWFYDGVRGLANVLGMLPNAYRQMRRIALYGERNAPLTIDDERMSAEERQAAAKKAGLPHIKDAADRLPSLAATVSVATARRKTAMPFLQDAALALTEEPYGWATDRIAELGDTTPKYVRDVKNAAKRRRGH